MSALHITEACIITMPYGIPAGRCGRGLLSLTDYAEFENRKLIFPVNYRNYRVGRDAPIKD